MKLTVGNKLFLSVLSVTLFVIALIVGLAGWSLRQGFSDYLTQTELNRQELLVRRLQEIYAARGNWDLFRESPDAWQKFVESILLQEQQVLLTPFINTPTANFAVDINPVVFANLASVFLASTGSAGYTLPTLAQYAGSRPAPSRQDTTRPPPNAFQECLGKNEGDEIMHRTPEGLVKSFCMNSPDGLVARPVQPERLPRRMNEPPIQTDRHVSMLARRLILMNSQGEQIAGVRKSLTDTLATRSLVHDGKVIGKLGIVVAASSSVVDQAFLNHSLNMLLIVAGFALLLCVIASLWMARHVKAILRTLTLATRRLASGEYSIRIDAQRQDEFGDLVRDFNRLAHALEQHENNRRLWVAQTSHELRTPVSILRAHIEALLDGIRSPGPQEFEVLLKETMRLAKLINDLNDLARADSGALAFQKSPVDLISLVQEMISSFSDRFATHHLSVKTSFCEKAYVFGDASRLRQLCANLFENSLRYTDPGGELMISISQNNQTIQWITEDSAPGVQSSVLASLFDPFFRAEQSRYRETGGTGLGLAICKSIVHAHEGEIQADHSEMGGVRLAIILPVLETT